MRSFDPRADDGSRSNVAADIPSACPACQSTSIMTTAKSPDVNTYWRCGNCGEIWNVSRREARQAAVNSWR